ncbi:Ig-like domain-containing protein [Paenibacillus alba]|uniref:Ig-like domain-containing protein n=1 Tax=Paenibacillus alba TaxID=1197127 RepID=A0ABU6G050_9BACL|nr:Ig-like domain-containing protein [Paenibacillus alba]MEC0227538.1 Ig-like domain-containing protein [Paenibacillus alba]
MKRNVNRYMSMMLSFVLLSLLLLPSMAMAVAIPVTSLKVKSSNNPMSPGPITVQMTADVLPADATDKTVTWSINSTSCSSTTAIIDPVTGVLTATGGGGGTLCIIATANDGSGVTSVGYVSVYYAVTSVVVGPSGATVPTGTTLQMTTSILPTDGVNKAVTWSQTPGTGTGTISNTGLFTGTSAGTVNITATANDGSGVSGTTEVTVSTEVSSVTVTSPNSTVEMGSTEQFASSVLPVDATNRTLAWSVTNGTGSASIDQNGLLTPTTVGTVTVVATSTDGSNKTGSKLVTVLAQNPVTSIEVKSSSNLMSPGPITVQMTATVLPADATDKTVRWSINSTSCSSTTATIDPVTGVLTATGGGGGTLCIIATANDGSGVTSVGYVTVYYAVTSVEVGPSGATVPTGTTLQMTTSIQPTDGVNKAVTWSQTPGTGTGTISGSGLFTGTSAGTVNITATAIDGSGVFGTMEVTVSKGVSSVTVTSPNSTVEMGSTEQFASSVLPVDATNRTLAWSVTNGTGSASIDQSGLLTPITTGTVTVVATSTDGSNKTDSKLITVLAQKVAVSEVSLSHSNPSDAVYIGVPLQLTASVAPTDATDKSVVWSVRDTSNYAFYTGLASITPDGVLTASAAGTIGVVVQSVSNPFVQKVVDFTASVLQVPVTGITLEKATSVVLINSTLQYDATISPTNATNKNVVWSITDANGNPTSLATIDNQGLITGVAEGTVLVTATSVSDPAVKFSETVSVQKVLTSSIVIGSQKTTMVEGETLSFQATTYPVHATDSSKTWSVVNGTGTGTISTTGATATLTALTAGTVTVVATANDGSGVTDRKVISITPLIVNIPVTSITVSAVTYHVYVNNTLQLNALVTPTNATNSAVVWSVTNGTGTASVSDSGVLTGLTEGTVTVTATAADGSNVVGSKTITIISVPQVTPVSSISISSATGDRVLSGKGLQLSAVVLPSNASNQTVTWSVYEGNATIDSGGFLTTNAAGYITVRATAQDGSDVYGSFVVTAYYASDSDSSNNSGGISGGEPTGAAPTVTTPTVTEPTAPKSSLTEKANFSDVLRRIKEAIETKKEPVKFSDTEVHWSAKEVAIFSKLGIVDGYADGSFKPNGTITRAEFATLVVRAFSLQTGVSSGVTLKDTVGHWSNDSVQKLISNGFVDGYPDGSFKPDNTISRAEVISIVSKLIDFSTTNKVATPVFEDVEGAWNKDQILKAAESGIISGKDDTTFDPNAKSTRSEALVILLRAMELNAEVKALIDQLRSAK